MVVLCPFFLRLCAQPLPLHYVYDCILHLLIILILTYSTTMSLQLISSKSSHICRACSTVMLSGRSKSLATGTLRVRDISFSVLHLDASSPTISLLSTVGTIGESVHHTRLSLAHLPTPVCHITWHTCITKMVSIGMHRAFAQCSNHKQRISA